VPAQAAGAQADSLPVMDCETQTADSDSYVCAPTEIVNDPAFEFPTCTTSCGTTAFTCGLATIAGTFGHPGACVPACFLSTRPTSPLLGNITADVLFGGTGCDTGEDCAPCVDPQTDEPTGLCPE
jgi:hypothetical protein